MSKRKTPAPRSAVDLARSVPSNVARAAHEQSGSGVHERTGAARRRAERRATAQALRRHADLDD